MSDELQKQVDQLDAKLRDLDAEVFVLRHTLTWFLSTLPQKLSQSDLHHFFQQSIADCGAKPEFQRDAEILAELAESVASHKKSK